MSFAPNHDPELLDALRLSLTRGLGPIAQTRLRNRLGSAGEVFRASREELLSVEGIGPKLASAIERQRNSDQAVEELNSCEQLGVDLLRLEDKNYPDGLREIPDPPQLLYVRGSLTDSDRLGIGIVGSRRCTLYGRQQAERFARDLSLAGITVISGLARGIDACAHRGAMEANGRTIAVLGTGVGHIYPPEHGPLSEEVIANGAIISEACLRQAPVPGLFPQRNRIISGLSQGVLIVEAARNSGALHTARHALEQGRNVFVVPGRLDSAASEGCHDLVRDGAQLVRHVDDILETLGPLTQPTISPEGKTVLTPRELNLNEQERELLDLIPLEPGTVD
ncbi:DNA-processing protein DprA, partial [Planctomycetaceae bacterium]|nr:DNA-processing protein DprA [Planctomycetaceae bacterium]